MQAEKTQETLTISDWFRYVDSARPWLVRFACPRDLPSYLLICLQLALILVAIHELRIEDQRPFLTLMALTAGGFVVHAWLPLRFRLPFFIGLSLMGVMILLGWLDGLCVLALGGLLFGICRLPVPGLVRVLLLVVVTAMLAVGRVDSNALFWPVLGSMFMFRLIVYLFETRQDPQPPLLHSLAYFFPLPNACFTLFPVIDFQTFRESYYNDRPYTIYHTGVRWIVRGLGHLLAYRLIKYYFLPAPHELHDLPHVLLFLAANYSLYLRVSGWFHIITGMLHLFGFNLPRTHQNYFLATSFTDIWRRINIYWKEFMSKVFFFPVFFVLRGWGTRFALVVASLGVFVATWLLHAYQTFWLLGDLPIRGSEAALWLFAGVLATVNLQFDLKRPAQTNAKLARAAVGRALLWSLKVFSMFSLISLFWALWTIPHFASYISEIAALPWGGAVYGSLALLAGIIALLTIGALVQPWVQRLLDELPSFWRNSNASAILQTVALLLLVAASFPQTRTLFGSQTADVLATLRLDVPTPIEAQQAVRGYYEELADGKSTQANPWVAQPIPRFQQNSPIPLYLTMTRPVDPWLERELIPGWSGEVFGNRLTINRFGMRDRENLTQAKPPATQRLALVGSSVVMGYGVGDQEPFPRLLEDRLNAIPGTSPMKYEVLNFGIGLCHGIHRLVMIDRKVWNFNPDAVYYVAHQDELIGTAQHLARILGKREPLLYPCLSKAIEEVGITSDMASAPVQNLLTRSASTLVSEIYRSIVASCREHNVVPVWILLPIPGPYHRLQHMPDIEKLAVEAGFKVINLSTWFEGHDPETVMFSKTDYHPNALGHRLIAERLEAHLRQHPELLPKSLVISH